MGQKPQATVEELEFVYKAIARGLSDLEIMEEMGDTEFPRRTDARYFRRKRREYNAARSVLEVQVAAEQDPLLIEKRRQHEEELVAALTILRNNKPPRGMKALFRWEASGPEPRSMDCLLANTGFPENLGGALLSQHLDPRDEILVAYRKSVEAFKEEVGLSTQLADGWARQIRARGLNMRSSDWGEDDNFIYEDFLLSVNDVALESGWLDPKDITYQDRPSQTQSETYFTLRFQWKTVIAEGNSDLINTAIGTHRALLSSLKDEEIGKLTKALRDAQDRYAKLSNDVDRLIDVRIRQRTFREGTCEVCEVWGGL
jgi:hypothetical protein